jgi:hypothetical protein
MRDGRNLFQARDKVTAQKAEMNSRKLYDLCDIKVQRVDRINQAQETIFSRNIITEKRGNTGSAENLPLHQGGSNRNIF